MCLILFSYNSHPEYKLIFASNRDEFYNRPTKQLHKWETNCKIYAGQDELNKGTWLGLTKDWKISAVTNYRDLSNINNDAPSRGLLVSNYLNGKILPEDYLKKISSTAKQYNGFNLLVGDKNGLFYFSNLRNKIEKLKPGVHGLSNHFLNTPWPKVKNGKSQFKNIINGKKEISTDKIFTLLNDESVAPDNELPVTGIGLEWERLLSSAFIKSKDYGTRTSSIIMIDKNDQITFIEKTFLKTGSIKFETNTVSYNL